MKISIVTVCHKSREKIKAYVNSFIHFHGAVQDKSNYEFIFVENSGDELFFDAVSSLEAFGFAVKVIHSKNEGFGLACNLGASLATGGVIAFVNPDIVFNGPLHGLERYCGKRTWGTVKQLIPDGSVYSIDLFPEYKGVLYELIKGKRFVNRFPKPFLDHCYVVGSFLVVERSLFTESKGFSPDFFLYYEETELCRRLQKLSGIPFIANEVVVLHEGLASHDSKSAAFVHEAKGFVTYAQITGQKELIGRRLRELSFLQLVSKSAKERFVILNELSKVGFR